MLCTRFIHGPAVGAARHQFFDISATVLTFNHLLYPPPILCHYDSFIIRYNKWEHNKNPQSRMSGSADFFRITLLFFLFLL